MLFAQWIMLNHNIVTTWKLCIPTRQTGLKWNFLRVYTPTYREKRKKRKERGIWSTESTRKRGQTVHFRYLNIIEPLCLYIPLSYFCFSVLCSVSVCYMPAALPHPTSLYLMPLPGRIYLNITHNFNNKICLNFVINYWEKSPPTATMGNELKYVRWLRSYI